MSRTHRGARASWAHAPIVLLALAACSAYDSGLLKRSESLGKTSTGREPIQAAGDGGGVYVPAPLDAAADAQSDGSDAASESGVTSCASAADYVMCAIAHADGVCLRGSCRIVRCHLGFFNCDGDPATGCEASLDTAQQCGACGTHCALSHVILNRCELGAHAVCGIDHGCLADGQSGCNVGAPQNGCELGFADCDGRLENGCETSLRTLNDCGGCNVSCSFDGAEASCDDGSCRQVGCAAGFGDCGNGCISLAQDAANCGACGNSCPAGSMCSGGRCTSVPCSAGTADCDGAASNACEADLTRAESCGSCDVSCGPYANASPGCAAGKCVLAGCAPGFADCDKQRDNGCEVNVGQVASCGACGNDCSALAHVVSAQCTQGACANLLCASGWGNCDGIVSNGCEQPLNTNAHCGSCSGTCKPSNGTGSCQSGTCTISACASGYDDCNAKVSDGCEASLTANSSCGTCGTTCASGTTCQSGGCSCTAGSCPSGRDCCNGSCVDTSGFCLYVPCFPGHARDPNNCGGCGRTCSRYCCG